MTSTSTALNAKRKMNLEQNITSAYQSELYDGPKFSPAQVGFSGGNAFRDSSGKVEPEPIKLQF